MEACLRQFLASPRSSTLTLYWIYPGTVCLWRGKLEVLIKYFNLSCLNEVINKINQFYDEKQRSITHSLGKCQSSRSQFSPSRLRFSIGIQTRDYTVSRNRFDHAGKVQPYKSTRVFSYVHFITNVYIHAVRLRQMNLIWVWHLLSSNWFVFSDDINQNNEHSMALSTQDILPISTD